MTAGARIEKPLRDTTRNRTRAHHIGPSIEDAFVIVGARSIGRGLDLLCDRLRRVRARNWDDVYSGLSRGRIATPPAAMLIPAECVVQTGELSRLEERRLRSRQFQLTGDRD